MLLAPRVLGIDPGTKGGLAVLESDGTPLLVTPFYPEMTEMDLADAIYVGMLKVSDVIFVEKVQYIGKRRDGRKGDGGQGAFTFGRVSGLISGVILARGIKPRYVQPMTWQGRLGCATGGNKNISKAKAIELFPGVKVTHYTADALLIARYGQLLLGHEL